MRAPTQRANLLHLALPLALLVLVACDEAPAPQAIEASPQDAEAMTGPFTASEQSTAAPTRDEAEAQPKDADETSGAAS